MVLLRRILMLAALWSLMAFSAAAQEEADKGFLTRAIQDALSGAGRTVSIDGFRGALSSTASFDRMTIADDEGVWLTLEGAALEWNRRALLRGRLEVQKLTADLLEIERLPASEDTLPDAEAAPFRLPELPVSIQIAEFGVERIRLGATVVGEPVEMTVSASALYSDDVANVDVQASRTDGREGVFALKANLERGESLLDVLLRLKEGPEGIAARVLSIPENPAVELEIAGSGPLEAFAADVTVATDGEERLAGQITLGTQAPRRPSANPDRRIQADIGGDITTVLAPRYRDFFGPDVRLKIDALLEGGGAVEVSAFDLTSQAAELSGAVTLNRDLWPTFLDIKGTIQNADGSSVLLPLAGDGTMVDQVVLDVDFDAARGDVLRGTFELDALSMNDLQLARLSLSLDGNLQADVGRVSAFEGDVEFAADGLALRSTALAEAVGERLTGQTRLRFGEGQPLKLSGLNLQGTDYGLTGSVELDDLTEGVNALLDVALAAEDLSRFSALVGQELAGRAALVLQGTMGLLSGQFDLIAKGHVDALRTGIAQADAVMEGRTELKVSAERNESGTFLRDLTLTNAALTLNGEAQLRSGNSRASAEFTLNDVGKVVPQYDGPVSVVATATQDRVGWRVEADTDGPYGAALSLKGMPLGPEPALEFTADVPEISDFVPGVDGVEGPVQVVGQLQKDPEGWRINSVGQGPFDIAAEVKGLVAPRIAVDFDIDLPEAAALVPQISGPLRASGDLLQTDDGFDLTARAGGPYGATVDVTGALSPQLDMAFNLSLPDVNPLVPQARGPLTAEGRVRQSDRGIMIDTTALGPYGARAAVEGLATGPEMSLTFDVSLPDVAPLAPGLNGPFSAKGVARQTPDGIALQTNASGPYSSLARLDGVVTGPNAAVDLSFSMPNIGVLVDNISGPLSVDGSARRAGSGWQVDTNVNGPAGTQARVVGRVAESGQLDLNVAGTAPLGLSKPFIAPRDLQGLARFELNVDGPASLSSVSGTIETSNASLSAPNLRLSLRDIAATIRLARNRANVEVLGQSVNGGQVRVGGAVTLTGALPAELAIGLQDLVILDPRFLQTTVNGAVRVAGPLSGGAVISGEINAGTTDISVPSTGITSIGDIPDIAHIGATRPVMSTRRKAGLSATGGSEGDSGGGGAIYRLNLRLNAPDRIFVRGRGIDAELGGGLTLTGTTQRVISAGQFSLIRGRLGILGQRFELVEGRIRFQGDLVPTLRFVTATPTQTGEVRVVVEGPANAPEVRFESSPEAPQDEVLAQLLFGRSLTDISPFQALQLANAVATLAGRGGVGVIANLREGFGLDDLEVTTTDSGAAAVRAGKYLSENVYTDVTAASDGSGEVSLNLDITPNLTGKATLESDGNSSLGIFFEKDY